MELNSRELAVDAAGHKRKIKPKPHLSTEDFNNRSNNNRGTQSSSTGGIFFTTKSCASCGHPLGLFLSRGYVCHKCGFKVCKKCKIYEQNSSSWNCMKCTRSLNLWKKPGPQDIRDDSRVKRSWSISGPSGNGTGTGTGSSPILKSYVQYKVEDVEKQFQFHSLPRMPTTTAMVMTTAAAGKQILRKNPEKDQSTKRRSNSTAWLGVDRQSRMHDTHDFSDYNYNNHDDDDDDDDYDDHNHNHHHHHQNQNAYHHQLSNTKTIHSFHSVSTLHPFTVTQVRKTSPSSSINFIEDEFWDYYDYRMAAQQRQLHQQQQQGSNRSSCERSLGETVVDVAGYQKQQQQQQQHCLCFDNSNFEPVSVSSALTTTTTTMTSPTVQAPPPSSIPKKPERKKCKSLSMGSYDARAKYSQLKTYCLVRKKKDQPANNLNNEHGSNHNHVKDDLYIAGAAASSPAAAAADVDEQFGASSLPVLQIQIHDEQKQQCDNNTIRNVMADEKVNSGNNANTNTATVNNGGKPTPTPTPRTRRRQAFLNRLMNVENTQVNSNHHHHHQNVVWRDNKGNPILGGTLPKNYKQTITITSNNEPFVERCDDDDDDGHDNNQSLNRRKLVENDEKSKIPRNAVKISTMMAAFDDEEEKNMLMKLPYGNISCSCGGPDQNVCDLDSKSDDTPLRMGTGTGCKHGLRWPSSVVVANGIGLNLPQSASMPMSMSKSMSMTLPSRLEMKGQRRPVNIMNSDPLSEFKVTLESKIPNTCTSTTTASANSDVAVAVAMNEGEIWQQKLRQLKQDYKTINKSSQSSSNGGGLINYVDIKHKNAGSGCGGGTAGREIMIPIKNECERGGERERECERDKSLSKQGNVSVTQNTQQQQQEQQQEQHIEIESSNKDPSKESKPISMNPVSSAVVVTDTTNLNSQLHSHVADLDVHVDVDVDTVAILQTISNIETICANANAQMELSSASMPSIEDPDPDPGTETDTFQDCNAWTSYSEQSSSDDEFKYVKNVKKKNRTQLTQHQQHDGFKSCEELCDHDHDEEPASPFELLLLHQVLLPVVVVKGVDEIPPVATLAPVHCLEEGVRVREAATSGEHSFLLQSSAQSTISTTCVTAATTAGVKNNCNDDGLVDHCVESSPSLLLLQSQSPSSSPSQGVTVRLNNQRQNNNVNLSVVVDESNSPTTTTSTTTTTVDAIINYDNQKNGDCKDGDEYEYDGGGPDNKSLPSINSNSNSNLSSSTANAGGMNNKKVYKSRVIISAEGAADNSTTNTREDNDNGVEVVTVTPEQVGVVTGCGTSTTVLNYSNHVKVISPTTATTSRSGDDFLDTDYRLTPPPHSPPPSSELRRPNANGNLLRGSTSTNKSLYNESVPNGIRTTAITTATKVREIANQIDANANANVKQDEAELDDVADTKLSADRRESPEGQESSESKRTEPNKHTMARYAPDGADKTEDNNTSTSNTVIKMCRPVVVDSSKADTESKSKKENDEEDDDGGSSTDSWTEEISFTEENAPPPLDLTLHTIVEESCDDEYDTELPEPIVKATELERYYNFATEGADPPHFPYEESEFSDTISESSFCSELRNNDLDDIESNLLDLAAGRPEKYFMSFGQNVDSDSVGSESDTDTSVSENRKKVLKHHRRSAEFEDEHNGGSEDDEHAFEQEGFDTIKKQRKLRKSSEDLLDALKANSFLSTTTTSANSVALNSFMDLNSRLSNSATPTPIADKKTEYESRITHSPSPSPSPTASKEKNPVSRSNSFTWSSDEEVNLMMNKLRQLVKNLVQNKKANEPKDEKLVYLESELIRLMRSENIKSIVDHISSDSDDDVQRLIEKVDSNQPELLNMVMKHIGQRLSTWMKDEDAELTDDAATIKCAASISSDLNEDRFSWKGSFESTLAKRQSVGSSDSLDCGGITALQLHETSDVFSDRSILRSSSLHHLANSQPILEESDSLTNSLPRLNNLQTSTTGNHVGRTRAQSLVMNQNHGHSNNEVKSARYRPPGYFEGSSPAALAKMENHSSVSTPALLKTEATVVPFSDGIVDPIISGGMELRSSITVRGQIEFSMQYDYKHSCFEMRVKQCRDLAAVDTKRGRSDPYVKVYLLPERTKSSKRKTKVKRNTLNPVFGEVLKFPIPLEELETRSLWVSVWHSDLFGKNEFLGQIVLDLKTTTFDDTSYQWFTLGDKDSIEDTLLDQDTQFVELVLALKWSPRPFSRGRGDLSVLIKEAKGLKCVKNTFPSTFVKCVPLAEKSKKQKTGMCRKSLHPSWNTTLAFDNISSTGIELSLYNYDLLNHELLYQMRLDSNNELWADMLRRDKFWVEGLVTFNEQ